MNEKQIEIVRSTVPLLEERGVELTRYFYERMLKGDSQVEKFFNPSHLHNGGQQEALAGAICAYAKHIDNPSVLASAVELIAHKHVSLMIQPEHYPIVGKHLLGSIQEVLGLSEDDPVIEAWAAAYQQLAEIFIERERQLYQRQKTVKDGWTGFRELRVVEKTPESELITSFYLKNESGGLPLFKPGQYITIKLPDTVPFHSTRNYSLSLAPNEEVYRISVKREDGCGSEVPAGNVSNFLHENVEANDKLLVGPPCGDFFLDTKGDYQRPLVLLSGGVGITPLLSMLHASLRDCPDRKVYFFHAARHGGVHAFREEVRELAHSYENLQFRFVYNEPRDEDRRQNHLTGLIDSAFLKEHLPSNDCDFFFCGPRPFMVSVNQQLKDWNVPEEQLSFEFFGPRRVLEAVPV